MKATVIGASLAILVPGVAVAAPSQLYNKTVSISYTGTADAVAEDGTT